MSQPGKNDAHQMAQDAYESGDLQQAMKIIQQCLADNRDDGRAWELCGLVHYSSGHFHHSVSALEYAALLVPLRFAGRVCLAHAYVGIGKTDLARDLMVLLMENPAIAIPLLLQVANALDKIDRPDLSMQACRIAIRRDEHMAQSHYDLGFYANRCGYPDAVVETLARKAIDLAPNVASFRVGLAGLLSKQGRNVEAHAVVEHLTNDDLVSVSCACCLKRVVELYQQAKDYRRVIVCQQRLLLLEISDNRTGYE